MIVGIFYLEGALLAPSPYLLEILGRGAKEKGESTQGAIIKFHLVFPIIIDLHFNFAPPGTLPSQSSPSLSS